jgi:PAS domain S-box-containing protein
MESTAAESGHPLGQFLRQAHDEILSEWERALRGAVPRARRMSGPRLRDHVPALLERLADVVSAAGAGEAAPLGELAELHAADRWKAGRDVAAAARELTLLRDVALRLWHELVGGQVPPGALDDVRRFDAALDEVIVRSVAACERASAEERRRALAVVERREQELQRFFAISPDLLAVFGADGFLKRVNPAYTAALGYSERELLSKPYLEFVYPADRERARAAVEQLLAGEESVRVTVRVVRKDGQARWFTFNGSAERGAAVIAAVGRDVTDERHRAEFEQQLIGIVSHDLRNPLSAIVTAVAALLMRHADLDERTLRTVGRIQSAADRAMTLIRDLLDFTKARTAGGIAIAPEPMDLHAHARAIAAEVQNAYPDREIRYEQSGSGEGVWDPGRIGQVVANLVSNAFKYGAADRPVVLRTVGDDRGVRVEVHNEGDPIDPALLPHIFEPLRQGRRTGGVGGVAGVGLGLYIVDHVVRAHGGRIDVTSTAAEGTTFVVQLPREPPKQE